MIVRYKYIFIKICMRLSHEMYFMRRGVELGLLSHEEK